MLNTCSMPFIAERISARQYKSGSILGIYVRTFSHLCRHVQVGVACAGTGLDMYAHAHIQYRLGVP